ncbi:MAG: hypothetical protein CM15mV89_0020 [Caudoviricetes sp.]|nr:MAG: hypothetical protein CM15mV89_0020 [Caudoviricetes sp.]
MRPQNNIIVENKLESIFSFASFLPDGSLRERLMDFSLKFVLLTFWITHHVMLHQTSNGTGEL